MARRKGSDAVVLYDAAARIVEEGLRRDGSVFTPGRPVWTAANVAELRRRFVDNPKLGKGKSFEDKFEEQLTGAAPDVIQLAAEMLFVYVWIVWPWEMKPASKRALLDRVLSGRTRTPTRRAPKFAARS